MIEFRSILVALGREGDPSQVLLGAAKLARCLNARIEIFLCDAERAFALQHQYDTEGRERLGEAALGKSRAWLERLWKSLDVTDVPATMEAVYETPLFEAVCRKARRSNSDLVIRGIGAGAVSTFSVSDYDLVYACPAPLLLTRGRPWPPKPNVAVAVDISGDESPERAATILGVAGRIASACGASLELLYASQLANAKADALQGKRDLLSARAAAANVHPDEVHVLSGDPARAIPELIARRGYDLLVLGATTHRRASTAQVGTLTQRLIETVECDLLLVKPTAADL